MCTDLNSSGTLVKRWSAVMGSTCGKRIVLCCFRCERACAAWLGCVVQLGHWTPPLPTEIEVTVRHHNCTYAIPTSRREVPPLDARMFGDW